MYQIRPSEITPEHVYLSRRRFVAGVGALLATTLIPAACKPKETAGPAPDFCATARAGADTDDLGAALTECHDIINYNNYYEFTTEKEGIAELAEDFSTSPWTVTVGGLVDRPGVFTVDELQQKYPLLERIYRMRCVEAWSAVIPWTGFPLSYLLDDARPTGKARFVLFTGAFYPEHMPGQNDRSFPWPYVEGLRLDEAMHNLTILATGLYGKPLPVQDGAPIRLVVPWKYGFKSIKAVKSIELVEEMPETFWMKISPGEYGFYSNVNPDVPHPRWSQSSERRLGKINRLKTLFLNGYADEVGHLYAGMDLRKDF